jgi:ribonuclease P protein subunit RPR2
LRSKSKKEKAAEIAEEIMQVAVETADSDIEIAKKQAELARRIMMKFNLRLGYKWKRFFCRKCKKLIVPGVNARVRINSKKRAVTVTCLSCGNVNRKILGEA